MDKGKVLAALDVLAVALTGKGHTWSTKERRLYEAAVRELK